ncbi:MAG: alpha-isopropylmalate synthase regulatory domain-containing protein, partial [Victivallales bacterium]|nr:alpha-isopropylmalate synthase regulatory domain-containing protein [Victivallales bacterium]
EKLQIAQVLLSKLRVDRLEIGSARVSTGEQEAVSKIAAWAEKHKLTERLEILGFVDDGKSVDWIRDSGCKVINMLVKGSEKHCRVQLRKTPQEHFEQVGRNIEYAHKQGLEVNVYLEDWSNGMRDSFQYIHAFMSFLQGFPVKRVMLPDTLGILNPAAAGRYLEWMYSAFPEAVLDFHAHNDYGLATANSLAAVEAGVNGIHTTVNGLGERAGNQSLCEIVAVIHDMTSRKTHLAERHLQQAAELLQAISGKRNSANSPVVGSDVFTQTCGVHADGDKKGNLYANKLLPERFRRKRVYALGKLSGKASLEKNLDEMGLELDKAMHSKVLQEIVRLGDKKKNVTPADLPFIISEVLRTPLLNEVKFLDYRITTSSNKMPGASVTISCRGEKVKSEANGDGGFDAFVKALRKGMEKFDIVVPRLLDYEVHIPPGGKTDALVETTITWEDEAGPLRTVGVDSDQIAAAIEATSKMLNLKIAKLNNAKK